MQFEGSQPAVLDQLKLFTVPSTESSLVKNEFIEYRPTSQVTDTSVIEFRVNPQENQYVDLKRSLLKVSFKLVKADGTNVGADDKVGVINNFLHSLFAQDDILLNQVLISPSSNNYPYKAYLDEALNQNENNSYLPQTQLYFKDLGDMDSTEVLAGPNAGLSERYNVVAASKQASILGPLRSDLCTLDRWILPGVDITVRLWPTKSEFRLMKTATILGDFKIKIDDIVFLANKITVKPAITQAQEQILKTVPAKYPFTRSRVHAYNMTSGSTFFRQDQIFQDDRPDRVVIGLVSSSAYQGSYVKNPFNFQDFGLKNIDFTVDDRSLNGRVLDTDFGSASAYKENYYTMMSYLGKDAMDANGPDITFKEFANGYALYVFDEYAGLAQDKNFVTDIRQGNSKLVLNFNAATTEAVTVVIYGFFNDMFEIDGSRKIIVH